MRILQGIDTALSCISPWKAGAACGKLFRRQGTSIYLRYATTPKDGANHFSAPNRIVTRQWEAPVLIFAVAQVIASRHEKFTAVPLKAECTSKPFLTPETEKLSLTALKRPHLCHGRKVDIRDKKRKHHQNWKHSFWPSTPNVSKCIVYLVQKYQGF